MGNASQSTKKGSFFDGQLLSHKILHHLVTLAWRDSDPDSNKAKEQLAIVFSQPENQHPDKLKNIFWNGTGDSEANPTLSILILMLAHKNIAWAKQILNVIVENHLDFNWNKTTYDPEHMGNTTPLLYLTMMAETHEPWVEDLLIRVIDHDIQRFMKNALIIEPGITIH